MVKFEIATTLTRQQQQQTKATATALAEITKATATALSVATKKDHCYFEPGSIVAKEETAGYELVTFQSRDDCLIQSATTPFFCQVFYFYIFIAF